MPPVGRTRRPETSPDARRREEVMTDGSRRQYRSQSVASSDPRSPYFTHYLLRSSRKHRGLRRSPSVACLPQYDDACSPQRNLKEEKKNKSNIPGLNLLLSPNDPKAATIHQNYYPEGGWGWVVLCCALIFDVIISTLHVSVGFFILEIRKQFLKGEDSIEPDHLNETLGSKRGYYLSSGLVLLGTLCLFLIDIHRYQVQKKKQPDLQQKTEILLGQPIRRRESSHETLFEEATPKGYGDLRKAQELTCISEEILVENFLEDYIDDCITSCNKEEKFLMLSEFENNLFKTDESLERERESSSQDDSDNMPNIPHHYCNICTRGHRHTEQPIYSPRKMMRTISNIDIIDEATSSL
ncbi:hypothetical protein TNIN_266441 [Trichonephila inaurata madagascariensis]|uniref:Uncharacterized protein n=1 Tax=Trichonephila inaurata madagascariensis TaxID=2747483 RepID=A0A8X6I628_9ARAC|nr:hypothetical protein TNIN_266441 [Trichonephila inaurata madagascariensis]